MEIIIALVLFVGLIASWFVLPGTPVTKVETATSWTNAEALQMAPAEG